MSARPEYTIRWVLTHEPIALFEDAAREFVDVVREESDGRIEVQVFTPSEYGEGERVPPLEVARKVAAGELEMSQTYTTVLGQLHERLWALDLPLLFRDHEHATEVLDGEIGRELLAGLSPQGVRGLAFTYSGGYRILTTTGKTLDGLDDMEGLDVRTSNNPVVKDLFGQMGAHPHPGPLWDVPEMTRAGLVEAAESTWPRYWDMGHAELHPVVHETSHSLFLTAIVISEAFWAKLPSDLRDVLARAALRVAKHERDRSVAQGQVARREALEQGITVRSLPEAEMARLETLAREVRARFAPKFGESLIERIQAAGRPDEAKAAVEPADLDETGRKPVTVTS